MYFLAILYGTYFIRHFQSMKPCQVWLAPQGWQAVVAHLRSCSVFTLLLSSYSAACWNSALTLKSDMERLLPAVVLMSALLRPGMQKQSETASFPSSAAWNMILCALSVTHSEHSESGKGHRNCGILATGAT